MFVHLILMHACERTARSHFLPQQSELCNSGVTVFYSWLSICLLLLLFFFLFCEAVNLLLILRRINYMHPLTAAGWPAFFTFSVATHATHAVHITFCNS